MGCNDGLLLFQNNLERIFNTRCMETIKDYKRVYCRILKLLLSIKDYKKFLSFLTLYLHSS